MFAIFNVIDYICLFFRERDEVLDAIRHAAQALLFQ